MPAASSLGDAAAAAAATAVPGERRWWPIRLALEDEELKIELPSPERCHDLRIEFSVALEKRILGSCTLTYQSLVAVFLQDRLREACALEQPPIAIETLLRTRVPQVRKLRISFRLGSTAFVCMCV